MICTWNFLFFHFSCDWDNLLLWNEDVASKCILCDIHVLCSHIIKRNESEETYKILKKNLYIMNGELSTTFPQFDYCRLVFATCRFKSCNFLISHLILFKLSLIYQNNYDKSNLICGCWFPLTWDWVSYKEGAVNARRSGCHAPLILTNVLRPQQMARCLVQLHFIV